VETAKLRNAFGRDVFLELGVPSGDSSHRLFHVSNTLGRSVIAAHIARTQAELVEANEQARVELSVSVPCPSRETVSA
jgi:hypothetical protein